jgi:exopolyphosphatase/guanosine-5'-triphosphate,3'-diphosphate pyrophosphatase
MERAISSRPSVRTESGLDRAHEELESWAARFLGDTAHERRVAQISGAMFDLLTDLHKLDRRAQWALTAAALIHDVGRGIDADDHANAGAGAILKDPSLRLSDPERRSLAYLTLHHRGSVPELGHDQILRDEDDRPGLYKALGLLRAADTLDSRSIDPPRLLLARRSTHLQICCYLREACQRAEKSFCRRKKYRLLEEAVGCTVDVTVQVGEAQMLLA